MARSRPQTDHHEPPVPAPAGAVVPRHGRLFPAPGTPLEGCPTNLDLATAEGKVAAFNALSAADDTVPVGGHVHFCARWWLVHPVEQADPETHEIHQYTRTVFIGADGSTVASCSDVVPHRLAMALGMFTPAEWARGIEFSIISRPRKRGPGNYHDLRCRSVPAGATEG